MYCNYETKCRASYLQCQNEISLDQPSKHSHLLVSNHIHLDKLVYFQVMGWQIGLSKTNKNEHKISGLIGNTC